MLAMNDRMGARWWLQYAFDDDGLLIVEGHWRQDDAAIVDGAPCFIVESHSVVAIGPPRGPMRLMPDPTAATCYHVAVFHDGPPDNPQTNVPPPPEFDGYARRVIHELTGEADCSEYALPKESAENLVRQNRDLVDRGRRMGSNHDYVAREIVTRTEAKGAEVPRREPKEKPPT